MYKNVICVVIPQKSKREQTYMDKKVLCDKSDKFNNWK